MILPPPNKDVALFPQKVGGKYQLLHRPMVSEIGKPSVWLAESSTALTGETTAFCLGAAV